jgi:hypothetical protein
MSTTEKGTKMKLGPKLRRTWSEFSKLELPIILGDTDWSHQSMTQKYSIALCLAGYYYVQDSRSCGTGEIQRLPKQALS